MDASETTIYHAVVIACIVMGTILLYFFISVIWQQRKILALRKKNMLREIAGLEKERSRIAADFHDELGPMLSAIKMKINSFDLGDPNDCSELEKTNEHIDAVINRIRHISFNLMPTSLLKDGLIKSLHKYIEFIDVPTTLDFPLYIKLNLKYVMTQPSIFTAFYRK